MNFSKISSEFKKNGLVILDNLSLDSWKIFNDIVVKKFKKFQLEYDKYKKIDFSNLNETRLNIYREINSVSKWENLYFNMASAYIEHFLGPDILIQRKLNLSIQMPNDTSSTLGMHTDTLSGQSPFEIVVWVAMTDAFDSNGMFYFDRDTSREIFFKMPEMEKEGLDALKKKYWDKVKFIKVKKSQIILFSGTLFHGNIVNKTDHTRISINSRFKNIYSPSGKQSTIDRSVGVFYKFFKQSVITLIGREYNERKVDF